MMSYTAAASALIICFLVFLNELMATDGNEQCKWSTVSTAPEVYYINLDSSISRKYNMEQHLSDIGMKFNRVSGLLPKYMYIPNDIETTWRTAWCKTETTELIPNKREVEKDTLSPLFNKTAVITGLCGRGKNKNTAKELGCTTSHLIAMRKAIYSTSSNSKYALIIEDDVTIPFNIDYDELAASAPQDFGILQLFNSNIDSMTRSWKQYHQNQKNLWMKSKNLKFWSTCGYLINREVMKPIIDNIIYEKDGWLHFKIIAGIQGPCAPSECCENNLFKEKSPCVLASFGYQADSFLYAMTNTYMLSIPLITNGKGVAVSTFHQEHVNMFHLASFRRQRQFINEMLSGRVQIPSFAKPACHYINETSF